MKKNLFIAAISLFAMVSCSNENEVDNQIAKNDNVIAFDTYVGKVTKAPLGQAFGVFAYADGAAWAATLTPNFMFNQEVETDGTYAPAKYWPEGKTVSFIAYSPYDASFAGGYTNTTAGLPYMTFTLPGTANTDLLVSDLVKGKDKSSGTISLVLKHALSKVLFTVKTPENVDPGTSVSFGEIKLIGMKKGAELTFGESARTWVPTGDASDFEVKTSTDYYMIPQNLTGIKAQVTYTITTTDSSISGGELKETRTAEVDLLKEGLTAWESSKQYSYALTIADLSKVVIDASKDDTWKD